MNMSWFKDFFKCKRCSGKDLEIAIEALKFYAQGEHFHGDWENPSGEPLNMLCLNNT